MRLSSPNRQAIGGSLENHVRNRHPREVTQGNPLKSPVKVW